MTRMLFETTRYVWAHGREPRGRGAWVFRPWGNREVEPTFFTGSYTEAKRQAAEWAERNGLDRVEVMP